ncbi:hypothetical protein C9374_007051 [Naegleria lovaniensis]|uniref:Adenylate and Guanylate cyclase catalytic domain containing protein n=1 Tax=Naegleria lovaniensis TaxID=51637 RepID=A0AA88KXX6_NAELO|nr:uncharacterized protein C9374_007051 [Naegleria lovaniensis]KAG2393520.1 hypothetical protein C9374_007051 [Naegleria lovaniensis]
MLQHKESGNNLSSVSEGNQTAETGTSAHSQNTTWVKVQSSLTSIAVTLQDKRSRTSWKYFLLIVCMHIYVMWTSIFIPTLGNYNWGEYGVWVFKAVNYAYTFSLDLVSYNAMIGLAITSLVIMVLYFIMLFFAYRTVSNTSKYSVKIKMLVVIGSYCMIFCGNTFAFIISSFIDCNTSSYIHLEGQDQPVQSLTRFPTEACYLSLNIGLIVACFVGIILLSLATFIAHSTVANLHPHNSAPFRMESSFTFSLLLSFNNLEIMLTFVIPQSVVYIRAVLHIVFSVVWLIILYFQTPFFRRVENSVYFAVGSAKLGAAIGSLISSVSNASKAWDLGLGMMGMTIGLVIILFVVGFITMELYSRLVLKRVESLMERIVMEKQGVKESGSIFSEKAVEKDALSIYVELEEHNLLRYLAMYLRFSIGEISLKNSIVPENLPNSKALSFVKGISTQKAFSNSSLLICSALIIAYGWNDENSFIFSISLLRKAVRHADLLEKIVIRERETEIEVDAADAKNVVEIKHTLENTTKWQDELKSLHRLFWKELMNELPSSDKVDQMNRRISYLTSKCESTFTNLMAIASKDKTVLRAYALFLEHFMFEKDYAQELLAEALAIEEDENTKRSKQRHPYKRIFTKGMLSKSITQPFEEARMSVESKLDLVELEKEESFSGVEGKGESKKETIFKFALRVPPPHRFQIFLLVVLIVFSFITLALCSAFSLAVSTHISEEPQREYEICRSSMATAGLFRTVRLIQNVMEMFSGKYNITDELKGYYQEYTTKRYKRMNDYVDNLKVIPKYAQSSAFSEGMYDFYIKPNISVMIPFIAENSIDQSFLSYYLRNSSMEEINNLVIRYFDKITNKWTESDFNTPLYDFEFSYLWANKIPLGGFYTTFCESLVANNNIDAKQLVNSQMAASLAVCIGYGAYAIIFVLLSRMELTSTKRIIKIYEENISKNVIGRVYHELGSKDDDSAHQVSKSILTIPKNAIPLFLMLSIILIWICGGLMYMETSLNLENATITGQTITAGSFVLRVVHRIAYRVGEYFTFYSIPPGVPVNNPLLTTNAELLAYRLQVRSYIADINNKFNNLVYGQYKTIGRYERIDELLKGVSNCSLPSNSTFLQRYASCVGLENMISIYASQTSMLNDKLFNKEYQNKTIEAFEEYFLLALMGDALSDSINYFMSSFAKEASNPNLEIGIIFTIIGILGLCVLNYNFYTSMTTHYRHVQSLRMMLNYIPLNNLDSNETLRNFVLHNQIPNKLTAFLQSQNKKDFSHSDTSGIRALLNASVDGAILCNASGLIDLINPAAQRMFGYKQSDIVGMQLFTVFQKGDRETIERTINELKLNTRNSHDATSGDSLELECVRKNQSTFPATINMFTANLGGSQILACVIKDVTQEKKHNALLAEEKSKSEHLLRNILPEAVAAKLKSGETFIAEKFNDITCFFSDMVNFTKMSSSLNPSELVTMLNHIVNGFDALTDKYNLEKIKTIGDAYFCVGGLHLQSTSDHPERCLRFSIEALTVVHDYNRTNSDQQINIRIGLNTGGAVAGVIGTKKFAYDLWGDTINVASRMESTSLPGRIHLSRSTYERVHDLEFDFEERAIEVKGKGKCQTYLLKPHHHVNPLYNALEELTNNFQTNLEQHSD